MKFITPDSLADVEFQLRWKSSEAHHEENLFTKVNFWRDRLPPGFADQLMGKWPGDRVTMTYPKEARLIPFSPANQVKVKPGQFDSRTRLPRYGRFYPLGVLRGLPNVFPGNIKPFRITGMDEAGIRADLNPPMAQADLEVSATVHDTMIKPYDRGGECAVLMECLTDGPGMQIRGNGRPTDFFEDGAFDREDETDDRRFYQNPRFVNHLDDRAIETITGLYGALMRPGMDVLDLMSGWRSHLPVDAGLKSLAGLGMNRDEMADNPQLTDIVVHDLNKKPALPYGDRSFDLAVCTASVEYLIHPDAVFAETARVLRPGGVFAVTFSNRWFPPKAIRIWRDLHEFERMGLVMEYFLRSGKFADLHTFSSRGWPRPEADKYYPQFLKSDPVYGVWGRVRD